MRLPFTEIMKTAAGGTSVFRPGALGGVRPAVQAPPAPVAPVAPRMPPSGPLTAPVAGIPGARTSDRMRKYLDEAAGRSMVQEENSRVYKIAGAYPFSAYMKLAAAR